MRPTDTIRTSSINKSNRLLALKPQSSDQPNHDFAVCSPSAEPGIYTKNHSRPQETDPSTPKSVRIALVQGAVTLSDQVVCGLQKRGVELLFTGTPTAILQRLELSLDEYDVLVYPIWGKWQGALNFARDVRRIREGWGAPPYPRTLVLSFAENPATAIEWFVRTAGTRYSTFSSVDNLGELLRSLYNEMLRVQRASHRLHLRLVHEGNGSGTGCIRGEKLIATYASYQLGHEEEVIESESLLRFLNLLTLTNVRRTMHIAVLGKTGSGKSSLLRYLAEQDIQADRGFLYFDVHGADTPLLLRAINARERKERRHLSGRTILIEPADPIVSVGLNPLEGDGIDFVRAAQLAQILRDRWHLDTFGARTDELLRNSLFVLSANGLTLVELALLLTDSGFRASCLKRVENAEIRQYFELRYDQASEPMRATLREPILNKTSAFTADPHFRHIVGQPSTFSMKQAMDEGYWVIVNLEKGRLGGQALTLGSLILTVLKNALFTREKRSLFTVYADEIQNLVAFGSGIETILSEARKFGVAVVSANQFLDQYPAEMRAAILSVATHVFFQLSSTDAAQIAQALDGGKPLAERLKNLYQRHAIVKSGADRWVEIEVPTIREPHVDFLNLLNRCRGEWGRSRVVIERTIAQRQAEFRRSPNEVINEWE